MRNGLKTANFVHKWLALLVGAQILAWLFSGLYMVLVDIDFIHGDPLVKNTRQALATETLPALKLAELRTAYPGASEIGVKPVLGRPFYTVTTPQARYLIEASSARVVSPLDATMATDIARYHYRGDAGVARTSLITADAPMELGARALPLWRIDFDDRLATSFYIDPYNGSLVTRRHLYWRIFDFLWMLHIMDYDDRSDIHHPLLWSAQLGGLVLGVSGAWLLVHQLGRQRKRRKRVAGR